MSNTAYALFAAAVTLFLSTTASAEDDWRDRFRAVTATNFDSGGAISEQFHLHAESYLTTTTVTAPPTARPLPVALNSKLAELDVRHRRGQNPFATYVEREPWISGVVVLHAGNVVFEAYPRMRADQRHFAWSVSKAVTAAVAAALVHDGLLDLDSTVADYLPELAESDWAEITVANVAHMASGIDCLDSDGYQDPTTCIYRMEETLGITADRGYDAGVIEHLAGMRQHGPAGAGFEYVSANTTVLGLIVEAATGKPFATVLSEQIWRPLGAESDALLAINDDGYSYVSGGVIARLRDIARLFELYLTPDRFGVVSDTLVTDMQYRDGVSLSKDWLIELIDVYGGDVPSRAAWQWDQIWDDGGMYKGGYLGQGVYVDPARQLVIAWFGTGEDYSAKENDMPAVSRQIARSGLFPSD